MPGSLLDLTNLDASRREIFLKDVSPDLVPALKSEIQNAGETFLGRIGKGGFFIHGAGLTQFSEVDRLLG